MSRGNKIEERRLTETRKREVYKRDNGCVMCHNKNNIEVHHIVPLVYGGNSELDNLVSLCYDCHKIVHKVGINSKEEFEKAKEQGLEIYRTERLRPVLDNKLKEIQNDLDYTDEQMEELIKKMVDSFRNCNK